MVEGKQLKARFLARLMPESLWSHRPMGKGSQLTFGFHILVIQHQLPPVQPPGLKGSCRKDMHGDKEKGQRMKSVGPDLGPLPK